MANILLNVTPTFLANLWFKSEIFKKKLQFVYISCSNWLMGVIIVFFVHRMAMKTITTNTRVKNSIKVLLWICLM